MNQSERGFIYLWALFAVTMAGLVLAGTGQTWQVKAQRENELELMFIGEEFRAAIMSYYNGGQGGAPGGAGGTRSGTQSGTQGSASTQGGARGEYPDSLEKLLEDKRSGVTIRHLRKIYLDPMTKTDDWGLVPEPPPEDDSGATRSNISNGIIGVYSLSNKKPMKKENFPEHFAKFSEAETYQDWQFVFEQDGGGNQTQQQNKQSPAGSQSPSSSPFGSPSSSSSGSSSSPFGSSSSSSSGSSSSPFSSSQSGQSGQGSPGNSGSSGSASPFAPR